MSQRREDSKPNKLVRSIQRAHAFLENRSRALQSNPKSMRIQRSYLNAKERYEALRYFIKDATVLSGKP